MQTNRVANVPKRHRDCERRLLVLDWLRSRHDHPTAAVCYSEIKRLVPGIGQSTVYRHLASLVGSGLAQELRPDDGPAHYDASLSAHAHFHCVRCKAVLDAPQIVTLGTWPGTPEEMTIVARGICERCQP